MKPAQLTLRELFLLALIAALGCGWSLDRRYYVAYLPRANRRAIADLEVQLRAMERTVFKDGSVPSGLRVRLADHKALLNDLPFPPSTAAPAIGALLLSVAIAVSIYVFGYFYLPIYFGSVIRSEQDPTVVYFVRIFPRPWQAWIYRPLAMVEQLPRGLPVHVECSYFDPADPLGLKP
jgi:hypothetical protein